MSKRKIISLNALLCRNCPICTIQFLLYLAPPLNAYRAYAEITRIYTKGPFYSNVSVLRPSTTLMDNMNDLRADIAKAETGGSRNREGGSLRRCWSSQHRDSFYDLDYAYKPLFHV